MTSGIPLRPVNGDKAFVSTSHINAYDVFLAARREGLKVLTWNANPAFPIPVGNTLPIDPDSWIFFTEESNLRRALDGDILGRFWPRQFPAELLDNKWAFAAWLKNKSRLTPAPLQWAIEDISAAHYPCVLKAKHSWAGAVKLPRGWICHSPKEIEEILRKLDDEQLPTDYFFLQEWLGNDDCRVISVCGFYDARNSARSLMTVVERLLGHSAGLSCSAAIQTIADQWNLRDRSSEILAALDYTGPFELEYLVTGERVVVLELNPRFWMQHSIFTHNGNGVMRRYLQIDTSDDWGRNDIGEVIWIDGMELILRTCTFRWQLLWLAIRKKIAQKEMLVISPSPALAIRAAWNIFLTRARDIIASQH